MRWSRARRSANYDKASEQWTLHSCSQGVFGLKNMLRDMLGATADKVRVLTGNVGGSFGMKAAVYPEYVCILHAARVLGRPVKWTDERSGSFVSDHHGRDYRHDRRSSRFDKRRPYPGDAPDRLRQYGRLSAPRSGRCCRRSTSVKNTVSVYRTPLLEVVDQVRVHQHDARLGLSRRRPAGRATTTWSG